MCIRNREFAGSKIIFQRSCKNNWQLFYDLATIILSLVYILIVLEIASCFCVWRVLCLEGLQEECEPRFLVCFSWTCFLFVCLGLFSSSLRWLFFVCGSVRGE